jgi:hypothetical protein
MALVDASLKREIDAAAIGSHDLKTVRLETGRNHNAEMINTDASFLGIFIVPLEQGS